MDLELLQEINKILDLPAEKYSDFQIMEKLSAAIENESVPSKLREIINCHKKDRTFSSGELLDQVYDWVIENTPKE